VQFRISFKDSGSDGNATADYIRYWSGEADTALRPALELSYDSGPAFEADTIVKTYAAVDTAYYQSIAGKALGAALLERR